MGTPRDRATYVEANGLRNAEGEELHTLHNLTDDELAWIEEGLSARAGRWVVILTEGVPTHEGPNLEARQALSGRLQTEVDRCRELCTILKSRSYALRD